MAISTNIVFVESENLLELDELRDADGYINDATVTFSLFEDNPLNVDTAGVAVDKGGGKVGIPVTGSGLVSGQHVRISGTQNYNQEIDLDTDTTANELVIVDTYVAETFVGNETVYVGIPDAEEITLAYVATSDGKYQGTMPDTVRLIIDLWYYAFCHAISGSTDLLIREKWKGNYY